MNITNIALEDFISVFTASLARADCKIAEQRLALQNEMREKYGPAIASFVSYAPALRIKKGSITVMARPFLKAKSGTDRMYLKFNGPGAREMHFEVVLE
jgi:hypothetical protein